MLKTKIHNILLTGSTGQLGSYLTASNLFSNILTPPRKILNLLEPLSIKNYFHTHSFDAIIHTAAIARMRQAQKDPILAMQTNIMGTCQLVKETIRKEKIRKKPIRFIYISTDGVYSSTHGYYKETDPTIPYNYYGWTKLGGECSVNLLKNFCIIRTRFFDPSKILFKEYTCDSYNSNLKINELAHTIAKLLYSNFTGTINIGAERSSDYARFKKLKPSIKPCRLKDIQKKTSFMLSRDASLDCSLWKSIIDSSSNAA